MLQTFPILLAGIAALTLTGCGQADHRTPAASEASAAMPSAQPASPSASARAEPGVTRPSPEPAPSQCGADRLGDYVNQLPTGDTMAKIRKAVGHERIRTIHPGDVVTMEFSPERLNIEIGDDGRIKLFRCG